MNPLPNPGARSERGIALVVALLVLLVLSLLAVVLMLSVNVDTKITGHGLRESQALNTAEAGVAEAMSRIRNQDILFGTNAHAVAQIFNCLPGNVPVPGTTDTTALATAQPAGAWLDYSTAAGGPGTLTVQYKTDATGNVILKYDPLHTPHVQTVSGYPIYVITSTGTSTNGDHRTVRAEVIQKPVFVNAKGAMVANVGINFLGTAWVCGRNHSLNTPLNTTNTTAPPCANFHLNTGTDLSGAWSSDSITGGGSSSVDGNPPTATGQTGFYTGPWDVFDMPQADFVQWIGAPVGTEPQPPTGVYYLDNNTVMGDQSGNFQYHGGNGEGLLYVDGDLTVNGNFTYKGLIYVEGDFKINGTCWVLGGIIVRGKTIVKLANGNCTVLYSSDAITQSISKYGGQFVNLSWRESNN